MGHALATSFQPRRIDVTIQLASGSYDANGDDTVTLTDMRVEFDAQYAGQAQLGTAHLRVFGMAQSLMNRLTVLSFHPLQFGNNTIRVDAGTSDADMSTVYSGTITSAMADYDGAPEVGFNIEAICGFFNKLKAVQPSTFPGAVAVSIMMQALAVALGATFENNGVTGVLVDHYAHGTLIDQVQAIAKAARIDYYYDGKTLAICPQGYSRNTEVLQIGPGAGLVGWPKIDKQGVGFTVEFNPAIQHGSPIALTSSVAPANGNWYVYALAHRLASQVPGGPWFSFISASEPGNVIRNG